MLWRGIIQVLGELIMSVDYIYFLGVQNKKTNKVRFAGPYNKDGKILSLYSTGSMGKYWEDFALLNEDDMDDEIKKEFETEDFYGNSCVDNVRIHDYKDDVSLPLTSKYVYADTVLSYRDMDCDIEELKKTMMTPEEYAIFCSTYLKNPEYRRKIYIGFENEEVLTTPKDYIFFQWVEYTSKQWEKYQIQSIVENLELRYKYDLNEEKLVILEYTSC